MLSSVISRNYEIIQDIGYVYFEKIELHLHVCYMYAICMYGDCKQ